jgi:hypothetical protein
MTDLEHTLADLRDRLESVQAEVRRKDERIAALEAELAEPMTSPVVVQWTPEQQRARKLVFKPLEEGWLRIELELRESQWRERGRERVTHFSLTNAPQETALRPGDHR